MDTAEANSTATPSSTTSPSSSDTPVQGNSLPGSALSASQLFDSVGPAYEDAFAGLPTQAASIQWLLDQLAQQQHSRGDKQPARVVDLGCGTGRPVCAALADAGHDVLGIDVSEAMVAAARSRVAAANARFELQDLREYVATTAAASPGSLDAVTAYFSLISDVTQADIRAVVRGVFGLLRPGGLFVFATVPLDAEATEIAWMGRRVVVSSLGAEAAVGAVRAAGFEVVHEATSSFLPRGEEAGICKREDAWEEPHLFVYARKPAGER